MAGPAADYRETGVRFPPLLLQTVCLCWSVTHLVRRLPCHGSETGSTPVRTAEKQHADLAVVVQAAA